ncbi:hypothetical protein ABZ990_00860 [Streptomyces sp. NPDC046203]
MARMPSAERRRQLVDAAIRVMTRDGVTLQFLVLGDARAAEALLDSTWSP